MGLVFWSCFETAFLSIFWQLPDNVPEIIMKGHVNSKEIPSQSNIQSSMFCSGISDGIHTLSLLMLLSSSSLLGSKIEDHKESQSLRAKKIHGAETENQRKGSRSLSRASFYSSHTIDLWGSSSSASRISQRLKRLKRLKSWRCCRSESEENPEIINGWHRNLETYFA